MSPVTLAVPLVTVPVELISNTLDVPAELMVTLEPLATTTLLVPLINCVPEAVLELANTVTMLLLFKKYNLPSA
jgi:hypothetical protein